jgi:hypothetical protein
MPQSKSKPKKVRVERDEAGTLTVHLDGRDKPVADARVARCFPWSFTDNYISLRDSDGNEVLLLRSLDELDPDSRRIVEDELAHRVFNPKIQRILNLKREFGITEVTADTDRGRVTFQIRSRDDVRVLSPTRALFRDVDGNTYELPDLSALDPASRKHVEEYL